MKRALRGPSSVFLLLSVEVAAVALLHSLGSVSWMAVDWSDLSGWLERTAPEDALGAAFRLAALAIAYWLLASTALYVLASATRIPSAVRAVEWFTLPALRRVVDRGVALSIATTSVFGGTGVAVAATGAESSASGGSAAAVAVVGQNGASTPILPGISDEDDDVPERATATTRAPSTTRPPAILPSVDDDSTTTAPPRQPAQATTTTQRETTTTRRPTTTTTRSSERRSPVLPGAEDEPKDEPRTDKAPPAPTAPPQVAGQQTYQVQSGDNLWNIAETHLAAATGRQDLSEGEVRDYWLKVVEANRGSLRSGDPDLIFPGESITLPSV